MRTYLADPPRWVLGVVTGVLFGVATGVYFKMYAPTWTAAILRGLGVAAVFGATMAFSLYRERRDMRAVVGELPANKFKAAYRAAERGPVPTDPEIRAAARRIATQELARHLRGRTFVIVGSAFALVASVGLAVIGSPWQLLYAPVVGVLLVVQWYWSQRLRRRIALLSEATEQTAQ
jgi:Flp pilus assembly protein TadB